MDERASLLERAKLADSTERYEEMSAYLKKVIESFPDTPLKDEERNTFSVAYKNRVGALRKSSRCLCAAKTDSQQLVSEYRATIIQEVKAVCKEVLVLLSDYLLKSADDVNSRVFYLKMKGDYHRYQAEVLVDLKDELLPGHEEEHKEAVMDAQSAYQEALDACEELSLLDAVKLGLILNYSVFLYEIAKKRSEACKLAKETYEKAEELKSTTKDGSQDSILILQLLHDNYNFWSSPENSQDMEPNDIEDS